MNVILAKLDKALDKLFYLVAVLGVFILFGGIALMKALYPYSLIIFLLLAGILGIFAFNRLRKL